MLKHLSSRAKPINRSDNCIGSTFIGILIGLVLGLAIALGVAWYINKLPNPFREKPPATKIVVPLPKLAPSADPVKGSASSSAAEPAPAEKPNLTAQELLTKGEGTPAEKAAAEGKSTPAAKETFFLQTGSFQNAPDADNLKARLALLGFEAAIQTRALPEKGMWHRVRLGPYSDIEELNRVRGVLKQNNIETALVKVREADK